jgi:hypothetical protein
LQTDPALDIDRQELDEQYRAYMEAGCPDGFLPLHDGCTPAVWHIGRMNLEARCYQDSLAGNPQLAMERARFIFRCIFHRVDGYESFDEDDCSTALPAPQAEDFEQHAVYGRMLKESWLRTHGEPLELHDVVLVAATGRMLSEGHVPFLKSLPTCGGPGGKSKTDNGNGQSTTPDPATGVATS